MPSDLRLQRTCTHEIFDELVTIQGLSPNFFSTLLYQTDGSSNFVSVRKFDETEGLSNYVFSRDGFTNWELATDNLTVNWNALTSATFGSMLGGPGSGIAGFLDAATQISPQPSMLVSYRCTPDRCPQCLQIGESRLIKDTEIDVHGKLTPISGNNKIKHLILKALLTESGSNEILETYGSTVSASIGEKFNAMMELKLHNAVQQAIRFLVNEQQNQPDLPLNETILNVTRVTVAQDVRDARIIRIQVDVQTADFQKVPVIFQLVNA